MAQDIIAPSAGQDSPLGPVEDSSRWRVDAERLELIMQATNEGLWDWDLRTNDVEFSPRWKQMLGYEVDELESSVSSWERRIHPDDRERVHAAIQAYLAGRTPKYEVEHRLRHRDGTWRWIHARGVVVRDSAGEAMRFVGSHADITGRKMTEEALNRQRGKYERLVNAIDGILWEMDAETMELVFTSDQSEQILGYPTARWTNEERFWQRIIHPEDRDGVVRQFERAIRDVRNLELEYRAIAADGRTIWFRDIATVIVEHERPVAIRGVMVDITERKVFEEELARRDVILEAVRFAGERFLSPTTSWDASVDEVLERLGRAAGVSRIYIFENFTGPDGEVWARNTHEWVVSAELSVIDLPQLQSMSYSDIGFGRWVGMLSRGKILYSHTRDLPAEERRELESEGTLSIVLVPIFVDSSWWGFIGLDQCERERNFSAMERDALKASADTLGAAIGRRRSDEELRESQRSMQTLLSNLPGMAYRIPPDHSTRGPNTINRPEIVSEGALDLTGYPPTILAGSNGFSFADIIHPEDREAMRGDIEAAIRSRQPYRLTYRITTAGGEVKWVMEQGRAVEDAEGNVVALEGIIIDVTDRIQSRHELERRVEERTHELATLLSVSTSVASTLELAPLIGVILDQLRQVVDHVAAAIFLLDGETSLRLLDYRGPADRAELDWNWPLSEAGHSLEVIRRREPIIIPDVHADTPLAQAFRQKTIRDLGDVPDYVASWMGVPLIVRERAIGILAVDSSELNAYTAHDAELALAFATQAAVAIENARLYEQAQGKAALEERQRLARELHDSVSQALFGIGLGARTARTLIDQDPEKAVAPIDYVLSLAEAGLAEMRALIFELRPEALEQEGLVAALEKQVAALRSRYGLEVELTRSGELAADPAVEEALYRIAQEALNNVVKHARASKIEVTLVSDARRVSLWVKDNGRGFDASGSFPGHLGLKTMGERAEKLGGRVEIHSEPGAGSDVIVDIPLIPKR